MTLYDLTNTYFEGESKLSALTQRGHSKEKRSDAPLVTLRLVLDGSGFPGASRIFTAMQTLHCSELITSTHCNACDTG